MFMLGCVGLMSILPQIVSLGVDAYLETHGYTYCYKLSRQWLFNRTMVYTKNHCE